MKEQEALDRIRVNFPADIENVWFKQEINTTVGHQLSFNGLSAALSIGGTGGTTHIFFTRRIPYINLLKARGVQNQMDFYKEVVYAGIPPIMLERIRKHETRQEITSPDMLVVFEASIATDSLESFAEEFVKQSWGAFEEKFNTLLEEELKK